ncbi:MAG: threonine-phosphate decarboxylase CobD [Syntrophomonadaceae bacterium]|jgi:threonine-phosphate decarboxylase
MTKQIAHKPIHGGNVWTAAQSWGLPLDQILDFSANINPLGPSPKARQAIEENLAQLIHYPEPTGDSCKFSLARHLGVDSQNLVLGNGGSELIYLLGRMFYKGRLLLLAPCFSEYGEGLEDPQLVRIPLDADQQFELPLRQIIDTMQAGDVIFIGNPNNPTGNCFNSRELLQLAACAQEIKATLVVDEAFLDFTGNPSLSLRHYVQDNPCLIVVGSLTKFFAIPGLRLGYAAAAADHISRMEFLLPTWRINTLALAAGRASLEDRDYIEKTVAIVNQERQFLLEQLQALPYLKVFPGSSNFLLINAQASGLTAAEWQQRLGPQGILIRNCQNFANLSPYYFRIAVKRREQNLRLLEALRQFA